MSSTAVVMMVVTAITARRGTLSGHLARFRGHRCGGRCARERDEKHERQQAGEEGLHGITLWVDMVRNPCLNLTVSLLLSLHNCGCVTCSKATPRDVHQWVPAGCSHFNS